MTHGGRDRRTFSDRHRERVRRANSESWKDWARTEAELDRAAGDDRAAAVKRGEIGALDGLSGWVHFGITCITAGLWLPVWLYVEVRNHRRNRRTPWGDADRTRRANAKRERRARDRARSREVARESWGELFGRRPGG